MVKFSNYLKQKGQGIVEYALLLAFVVGIAVALQGVGLKDAVVGVFDDVATVLAGSEFDLSTPEGRKAADLAAMKKIGKALADNVVKGPQKDWNTIQDGKLVIQKNFMLVAVFSDGTVDAYVDGQGGSPEFWLSTLDENSDTYKNYMNTLNNAGIDLTNPEKLKSTFGVKDDSADWKNGYAVAYDNGNIKYMALPSSMTSNSRRTTIGWDTTGNNIIARREGVWEITNTVTAN